MTFMNLRIRSRIIIAFTLQYFLQKNKKYQKKKL